MLTFDAQSHSYQWNGKPVPSVTSVLSPIVDFSRVPPDVLKAASDFGTAVHLACELDDLGQLDEDSLDPALFAYVYAWRAFSKDHDVAWEVIEQPVYNQRMRYAGTPDRIGDVSGGICAVDIKSTAELYPSVGPQLAAYSHAFNESLAPVMGRIAVQLKPDGTYVAKEYKDPTDWPLFCSLLTVRTWCAKNRIEPNFKEQL